MFRSLGLIAVVLAVGSTQVTAAPVPNFVEPVTLIKNSKDYNRLRKRAMTADELKALAAYCQARVSKYEADKKENQAELDRYNSKQHMPSNPKFRSMDDLLKTYIAGDEKAIARWTQLRAQYSDQARKLEGTETGPGRF
jgi:hypothetical protein